MQNLKTHERYLWTNVETSSSNITEAATYKMRVIVYKPDICTQVYREWEVQKQSEQMFYGIDDCG